MTAPKSQNGSLVTSVEVLSASNAPQPPSADCMPVIQRSPRPMAGWRPPGPARPGAVRRSASTASAVSSMSG